MHKRLMTFATGLVLLSACTANAQVTSGILYVNNTHMS